MQIGTPITDTVREMMRQAESKSDYTAPSESMTLRPTQLIDDIVSEVDAATVATPAERQSLDIEGVGQFPVTDWAHGQIADSMQVPRKYYARMQAEAPELLRTNVNHWLKAQRKDHLVRTLDGDARAFLSTSYRTLDNLDVANMLLGVFQEQGLEIKVCHVTSNHLHLTAVSDRLRGEVKIGDEVQGGITVKNSEVGAGAFAISDFWLRLWCLNGCASEKIFRQTHLGGKLVDSGADAARYIKNETRELRDAATFSEARDVVTGWLSDDAWQRRLGKLQVAAGQEITATVEDVCERTAKRLDLRDTEASMLLEHLAKGGDFSRYGLSNAVTRLAHDADSFDRNVELQEMGGEIITLSQAEWKALDRAA